MVKNLSIFQLHSFFCSGRNFKHECRFFYLFIILVSLLYFLYRNHASWKAEKIDKHFCLKGPLFSFFSAFIPGNRTILLYLISFRIAKSVLLWTAFPVRNSATCHAALQKTAVQLRFS